MGDRPFRIPAPAVLLLRRMDPAKPAPFPHRELGTSNRLREFLDAVKFLNPLPFDEQQYSILDRIEPADYFLETVHSVTTTPLLFIKAKCISTSIPG